MIYNLFLDDYRIPKEVEKYTGNLIYRQIPWYIVRNYNQFTQIIKENGIPEVISFDHDLTDVHYHHQNNIPYDDMNEKTGYHCAKWLINYCIDNKLELPSTILIHSMNLVGAQNIKSLFDTYNKIYNDKTV